MQCGPFSSGGRPGHAASGEDVKRPLLSAAAAIGCAVLASVLAAPLAPARAEAAADNASLLLHDGFDRSGFAAEGGLFYKENFEQRGGRVVFGQASPFRGTGALTLTATASCPPDRVDCSERAEAWERPEVLAPYRSTVWYGLTLRLDEPLPQDDRRHVIAQWKREIRPGAEGNYSPFLALRLYRGRLGITVETDRVASYPIGSRERPDGCRPGEALVLDRPKVRQTRALVAIEAGATHQDYPGYFNACAPAIQVTRHADLPSAKAGWIDFVIRSQPGPDGGGHVEIIAGGVQIATIRGHIGHGGPGLDANQYFKFGPYRAPGNLPWSVSYGDFRRGPRCSDVIRLGRCPAEGDDLTKVIGKTELSTSSDVR